MDLWSVHCLSSTMAFPPCTIYALKWVDKDFVTLLNPASSWTNTSAFVFGLGWIEKLKKDREICNYNASAIINDIFLNPFPVTLVMSRAVHVEL